MCRNIRPLHNFAPSATRDEVRAAALQYVRKVAGTSKPARANEAAFLRAVDEVAGATERLLDALVTSAPPRNREAEAGSAAVRLRSGEDLGAMPVSEVVDLIAKDSRIPGDD